MERYVTKQITAQIGGMTISFYEMTENDNQQDTSDWICNNKPRNPEALKITENLYKFSLYVHRYGQRFIAETQGEELSKIKNETRTKIFLPKPGEPDYIVITGQNADDVKIALFRMYEVFRRSRRYLDGTAFVCIPGNTDEIKQNFNKFKQDVLKTCSSGERIITEKLFRKPETLCVRLNMLVLLHGADYQYAIEQLDEFPEYMEPRGPFTIELRGVKTMDPDPTKAKALYIRAHDKSGRLQMMSSLVDELLDDGSLESRRWVVEHHWNDLGMTAMSTKYVGNEKCHSFDATEILKTHADTYFGTITVSSIHLCSRDFKTKDGFYKPIHVVEF